MNIFCPLRLVLWLKNVGLFTWFYFCCCFFTHCVCWLADFSSRVCDKWGKEKTQGTHRHTVPVPWVPRYLVSSSSFLSESACVFLIYNIQVFQLFWGEEQGKVCPPLLSAQGLLEQFKYKETPQGLNFVHLIKFIRSIGFPSLFRLLQQKYNKMCT